VVEALLKAGHKVRVLDSFCKGDTNNLLKAASYGPDLFTVQQGTITSLSDCQVACEGIDYVIHLAALKSVPESFDYPVTYNTVNIDGTLNILTATYQAKVKRLVFASSAAVYGDQGDSIVYEGTLPRPQSPYGLTKLTGEHYCRLFAESYGLPTVALRFFNVYGPRASGEMISLFTRAILKGEKLTIFGTGNATRDFIYIDDLVESVLKASTQVIPFKHVTANIASGKARSVSSVVYDLYAVLGLHTPSVAYQNTREGDILHSQCCIWKAKEYLDFKPLTDFERGLKRTVEFIRDGR
jgi:nucleoside-diphosphate-sugar epimerase